MGPASRRHLLPPERGPQERSIHPATAADIDRFVADIDRELAPCLGARRFVEAGFRIPLALHEAVINAWRHGNGKDPGKAITVRWRFAKDLILEVIDEGAGFDPQDVPSPTAAENLLNARGRGIAIISQLTKRLFWLDGGRHLVAHFGRRPPARHRLTTSGGKGLLA